MNLIAVGISKYKALTNQLIELDHRYSSNFSNDNILYIRDSYKDNYHYYGEKSKYNLILGSNGTGKTTTTEVIEAFFKKKPLSAFYIWQKDEEIYVYDPYSLISDIHTNLNINLIYDPQNFLSEHNINLVKLSNVIDINKYAFKESIYRDDSHYINLTSNRIIRKPRRKILSNEIANEIHFVDEILDIDNSFHRPQFLFKIFGSDLSLFREYILETSLNEDDLIDNIISKITDCLTKKSYVNEFDTTQLDKLSSFINSSREYRDSNRKKYLEAYLLELINAFYRSYHSVNEAMKLFIFIHFLEYGLLHKKALSGDDFRHLYGTKFVDVMIDIIDRGYITGNDVRSFMNDLYHIAEEKIEHKKQHNSNGVRILSMIDDYVIKIYPIDSSINELNSHFIKNNLVINKYSLELPFNNTNEIRLVNNFIDKHRSIIEEISNIGWSGMSSGEEAKIKLLSRLSYGLNSFKKSIKANYLVLVDEIDLYLNPKWQRDIVSEFNIYSKKNINDNDSIHFILTSHSPIVASDILPIDIYHLSHSRKTNETKGFGSNIKDLYTSSFNISKTLGKLSGNYIDNLVKAVEERELSEEELNIVELIGSDFVKNYILSRMKND
ncbi:hypothetical protein AB4428_07105 [Vibrio lentus]